MKSSYLSGYPKQRQEESKDDPDEKSCEFCGWYNSIKNDVKCALCGSLDWKHYAKKKIT